MNIFDIKRSASSTFFSLFIILTMILTIFASSYTHAEATDGESFSFQILVSPLASDELRNAESYEIEFTILDEDADTVEWTVRRGNYPSCFLLSDTFITHEQAWNMDGRNPETGDTEEFRNVIVDAGTTFEKSGIKKKATRYCSRLNGNMMKFTK